MNKTVSSPNFKKKKEKMAKSYSTENFDRPLITKIKASKTKR